MRRCWLLACIVVLACGQAGPEHAWAAANPPPSLPPGQPNGLATLDATGHIPSAQVPGGAATGGGAPSGVLILTKRDVVITGAAYGMAANVSWLSMAAAGPVPAQTVTPPPAPADGQMAWITTSATINAFSFSPAVGNWANGSPLPAGAGITIGWDTPSGTWKRMQ